MASEMNIQDSSALGARKAFLLRPYKHIGWGAAVFAVVCFVLMLFLNPIVAAALAFLPAFGLYYYLESRLIVIECLNCEGDINTNTPWECGFKGCRNENVVNFPFVHECEHCHYPPKAYVCHHCGALIYLTSDRQTAHAAKRLNPAPPPVKTVTIIKDVVGDKIATQKQELRELEHLRDKTRIVKEIEVIKSKPAVPPPLRTEVQYMVDRLRRGVENRQTLIDQEREFLEQAREKYRNDPEGLYQAELDIKEAVWIERERLSGGR